MHPSPNVSVSTDPSLAATGTIHAPACDAQPVRRRWHRLRQARRAKGLSIAKVAGRLGLSVEEAKAQEHGSNDLPLSVLRRWAKALGTPVEELLIEPDGELSMPRLTLERMARLLKLAAAMERQAHKPDVKRLAQRLIDELVDIEPTLNAAGHDG